jgi:hypothetical protein
MRQFRTVFTACVLGILLSGCAKPLPAERAAYAGVWRGGPILLVVLSEGRVTYLRKEGNRSTSVNAPVKEFKGDNFIVGVGFMNTEFVVSSPPHEEGGVWQMTVDGVALTRTAEDPGQVAAAMSSST